MDNIITNLDEFINEGFLNKKHKRNMGSILSEDDFENFKNFITTVKTYPYFAKITKNNGIFFDRAGMKRFTIEVNDGGIFINDDLSAPSMNVTCHISKDNMYYNKALKLLHSAVQTVKNDLREIKYR